MPPKARSNSKHKTHGKMQVDKKQEEEEKTDIIDSFYNPSVSFVIYGLIIPQIHYSTIISTVNSAINSAINSTIFS